MITSYTDIIIIIHKTMEYMYLHLTLFHNWGRRVWGL